jgi:phage tail-like protein
MSAPSFADLFTGVSWSFGVEVDGLQFKEVTKIEGLKLEVDAFELKTNGLLGAYTRKKLAGRMKSGQLTLSRAFPVVPGSETAGEFIAWIQTVFVGDMAGARKNMIINIYGTGYPGFSGSASGIGSAVASFTAINCWPVSVDFGSLTAGDATTITEKVTVHHEGLYETVASKNAANKPGVPLVDGGMWQF